MWTCAACLSRSSRIFSKTVARPRNPRAASHTLGRRRSLISPQAQAWLQQRAGYSQAATAAVLDVDPGLATDRPSPTPTRPSERRSKDNKSERPEEDLSDDLEAAEQIGSIDIAQFDSSPPQEWDRKVFKKDTSRRPEPSIYKRSELEKELKWLEHPVKMADRILELCQKDLYFKALSLVRLGTGGKQGYTVSWNHLIDYDMFKGRASAAVKTYNEMKKRGQQPDAHTYTTLFRGLARNAKYPSSLERALSIYHSMFAPNAPVKPSIIHTNAVLTVCSMAEDMDALYGVAAKLPERGSGAPDATTYTITLAAIRDNVAFKVDPNARSDSIRQGRIICQDILRKWSRGDLQLDDALLTHMARLLILGGERDIDGILTLYECTTGVGRQAPHINDPKRSGATPSFQKDPSMDEITSAPSSSDKIPPSEDNPPLPPDDGASYFASLLVSENKRGGLVRPTAFSLTMIIKACRELQLWDAAQAYYDIYTREPFNIIPNHATYSEYLKCLGTKRASKAAFTMLQTLLERPGDPHEKHVWLPAKFFHLVITACRRDENDLAAFEHASATVRMMLDYLPDPDALALDSYIRMIWKKGRFSRDLPRLLAAEELGHEGWTNIRSKASFDEETQKGEMAFVVGLAQSMIRLYRFILIESREGRNKGSAYRKKMYSIEEWLRRRSKAPTPSPKDPNRQMDRDQKTNGGERRRREPEARNGRHGRSDPWKLEDARSMEAER